MSRRILVVEDQDDNQQILRDLLNSVGYEVIEAEQRRGGIARGGARAAGPHSDGHPAALARRLRGDPPDQGRSGACTRSPIIVVTSYALSGDEAKARAAGCDAYVTKPYSPRALLAKIREYLP